MRIRRGMTLLESVLALSLFSILSVSSLGIWRYASTRSLQDSTLAQLTIQSNQLIDAITTDIRSALFCEVRSVGGNQILLIALPASAFDTTADGVNDYFGPSSVTSEGLTRALPGSFIWYGMANSNWDYSGTANRLKRQVSLRDRLPIDPLSSFDSAFNTEFFGNGHSGVPRFRLIENVTFSVDAITRRVTVTVVASSRYRRRGSSQDTAVSGTDVGRITTTRVITWGNGF